MIYQFRVTLPGLKGFYRIYKVNSANSLYHFHKQLQSDLAFPADQPILFKAYDADENVVARYALIDLGFGTVDDVTIEKALKDGAVKFDYYYDTQSKKRVILTLFHLYLLPVGNKKHSKRVTLRNNAEGNLCIAFYCAEGILEPVFAGIIAYAHSPFTSNGGICQISFA